MMATQVWNGRKEDWRGCPPPLALVEGAWPLRVEFAKEDRVDNHYLVAGRLADLPARAVVIADDDVDLGNRAQSVSLLLKAWRASDDRIVGPSSSARGFAQPAHDAKGHLVNAMRNPSNPVGHVFCALLPQLVVVPVKYLRLYADHKNVVDFVGAHQICDDFALAAVSGVAARAQARNATALAIADVGVGHRMGRGSLSAVPGHYERRAACARGIATAMRRDHPGLEDPVFEPSSTYCGGSPVVCRDRPILPRGAAEVCRGPFPPRRA